MAGNLVVNQEVYWFVSPGHCLDQPSHRKGNNSMRNFRRRRGSTYQALSFLSVLPLVATVSYAQTTARNIKWAAYQDLAVDLMRQYLRIDTSNPPGNEIEAAKFFKAVLEKEGITSEIFEYKPGRANIIARFKGNGSKRPIILLNHMDVVTADPSAWRVNPFSAEIVDGSIYGRGALDMKGEGLLQLMTMIILAREKPLLSRDVIFLATADEEVKDEGSIWMIANKSELFKDAEYLLTEGGDNL